jgi:hypothetical protein
MNEILSESEKEGGVPRPLPYMQAFRECLSDCGLEELGYIGNKFTWKRGQMRERLDRAVGNAGWSQLFPRDGVHHLTSTGSDHRPIFVDTETYGSSLSSSRRRRRFEGRWLQEEQVGDAVSTSWVHSPPGAPIMAKLAAVHSDLHEWDRTVLNAPQKKIKELTKELEVLLSGPMTNDTAHKQKEVTRQMEVALEQEEVHYMQRSRANWLMHGDKNTAFFHNYAKARRKRNTILKLKDGNGEWIEGNDAMGTLIHEYFSSLFTSEVQQTDVELLNRVIPRVTSEMNASLLKSYTSEEVKALLEKGLTVRSLAVAHPSSGAPLLNSSGAPKTGAPLL